jgi:predicted RNase H-like HicB family nuclease
MVAMSTYTAVARRDEGQWHIRIPGLGTRPNYGITTQARTLHSVEAMARDLIAVYQDIPEDSFDIKIQVELPASVRRHLQRAVKLRNQAAHAQAEAADEYRAAARELKREGLTVRDIGDALEVSHQRAHQLISA